MMGTYRKAWGCCGSVTETESWEPERCPFCSDDCAALRQQLDAALDVVVALGAEVRLPELEEARRLRNDAERYRWLRDYGDNHCTEKDGYGGQTLRMGAYLDAAIDAAMAKL